MKKLLTFMGVALCLFAFQNVSAQCGAGQMPVDLSNGIGCSTDIGVTLNSGGSVNQYLSANGTAVVCISSGDYATSINVTVIGGSSVVLDLSNPNLIGNLCVGGVNTRYDAGGTGFVSTASAITVTLNELP